LLKRNKLEREQPRSCLNAKTWCYVSIKKALRQATLLRNVSVDDNHFNVNKDVHQKTLVYIGDIFVYDAGDDDAQDVEEDANNKETPSYSISSLKLAPTTKEVIVETLE